MQRSFFPLVFTVLIGFCCILQTSCSMENGSPDPYRFYVGSGDGRLTHPIYLCELDPVAEAISVLDSFPAEGGAGYLDLGPDGSSLYATSGKSVETDQGSNSIAAFRVLENDAIELINRQSSRGRGVCHVQSSPDGRYVFAANYSSGHATALPVLEDGSLGESTSVVEGEGSGPNKSRQEGPHAHQAMMDPSGRFLYVPDLGTDKLRNYVFDAETGTLKANPNQAWLEMSPGSGPRHMAFHPDRHLVFILGEMEATVTACTFNPKSGVLKVINKASIVVEGYEGNRQSAAVRVHPGGKFVYATNRSDKSVLSVFEIRDNGEISRTHIVRDIPYWPRDFNLTPDGKYMVIAGARVNELAWYSIAEDTGIPVEMDSRATVPGPISIEFID